MAAHMPKGELQHRQRFPRTGGSFQREQSSRAVGGFRNGCTKVSAERSNLASHFPPPLPLNRLFQTIKCALSVKGSTFWTDISSEMGRSIGVISLHKDREDESRIKHSADGLTEFGPSRFTRRSEPIAVHGKRRVFQLVRF
ncbi:hypothetical protein BH11ARM2_BH11ARM2_39050 [soil metagenome]